MGSSNYITNIAGEVSQHTEYFAFGETFVEEHKGSNNSPYKFNGKELDNESGLYYYGARYYDPRVSIWMSVDSLVEETMDSFGYCYQNPINYFEPDGCSPVSVFLKMLMKVGAKKAIKEFAENQIKKRLSSYTAKLGKKQFKEFGKEFAEDLDGILETLDSEWWETAIELVPVAGDIYGTSQFALKLKKAYDALQDLENKYVGKLVDQLPETFKKEFKDKMRRKGVSDAQRDQRAGLRGSSKADEEKYVRTKITDPIENRIEGDHDIPVLKNASKMSDPRNITLRKHNDHKEITRKQNTTRGENTSTRGGKKVSKSSRHF